MDCVDMTCPGWQLPCYEQCAAQHPEGAELYLNLLSCVFCLECAMDCGDEGPSWLCVWDD